jgi:hypothetical protein
VAIPELSVLVEDPHIGEGRLRVFEGEGPDAELNGLGFKPAQPAVMISWSIGAEIAQYVG